MKNFLRKITTVAIFVLLILLLIAINSKTYAASVSNVQIGDTIKLKSGFRWNTYSDSNCTKKAGVITEDTKFSVIGFGANAGKYKIKLNDGNTRYIIIVSKNYGYFEKVSSTEPSETMKIGDTIKLKSGYQWNTYSDSNCTKKAGTIKGNTKFIVTGVGTTSGKYRIRLNNGDSRYIIIVSKNYSYFEKISSAFTTIEIGDTIKLKSGWQIQVYSDKDCTKKAEKITSKTQFTVTGIVSNSGKYKIQLSNGLTRYIVITKSSYGYYEKVASSNIKIGDTMRLKSGWQWNVYSNSNCTKVAKVITSSTIFTVIGMEDTPDMYKIRFNNGNTGYIMIISKNYKYFEKLFENM